MDGGEVKTVSFLGLVLVNHLLQQLIQIILVLQHSLPLHGRLNKYGDQKQHQRNHESLCRIKEPQENSQWICYSSPCKTLWFQICYLVHVSSQVWSSTIVVWSFLNKKWVILSHFSLVQKEYKDFELVLLRQICQRIRVLNYASKNGLRTK